MRAITLDALPHLINCAMDIVRGSLTTALTVGYAGYWGVKFGKRCRFYGMPLFRRMPESSIRVGSRCGFRSAFWSNFAGINHPCILATLAEGAKIQIGDECGLSGVAIGAATSVEIGNRVMIGANSIISDTDWHPIDHRLRAVGGVPAASPIMIEDDVWIGANVSVLKGVRIGARSVIAANSVVTKSIPADVVAGGVPAKPLKPVSTENGTHLSEVSSRA